MRVIKFRGRESDDNWHYGSLIQYKSGESAIANFERYGNECSTMSRTNVDPATVGQFTGFTDKNGKEIYEGDIIMINLTDGSIAVSSVVWNRRGYWGCDIDINHGVQLGLIDKVRIEVIGNIHDNLGLLKGGEQ